MSLASIKEREAKGRKNALPKLRTVLANPYKQHCPVLQEDELNDFCAILKEAIGKSGGKPNTFATQAKIRLGLESSLRAINGRRFSCVFLSLSMRPSHLIRLIASSAAAKVQTAPIYAQPKLEELTEELFGVRALVLVLPTDLDSISLGLAKWVEERRKPELVRNVIKANKPNNPKRKKPTEQATVEDLIPELRTKQTIEVPEIKKPPAWSGDYIDCSDSTKKVRLGLTDAETAQQKLQEALGCLAMKAEAEKLNETKTVKTTASPPALKEPMPAMPMEVEDADEEDEFLPSNVYHPLTVHHIQSNPNKNKKHKKRRNKKQQQQGKATK
ncbi:uncharacterized protein LOC115621380 [Scaptodrosophila lebanonensis]|uniref:Uncharacterized protein LOC115621380 n=1 Tax=Drosophila lebanonensis TaxID=7225 RepID=A0A6J2T4D4_DROLE|nr:uncharacterized protein LOC115621380 [Scaptodrosophila lebanonensis]